MNRLITQGLTNKKRIHQTDGMYTTLIIATKCTNRHQQRRRVEVQFRQHPGIKRRQYHTPSRIGPGLTTAPTSSGEPTARHSAGCEPISRTLTDISRRDSIILLRPPSRSRPDGRKPRRSTAGRKRQFCQFGQVDPPARSALQAPQYLRCSQWWSAAAMRWVAVSSERHTKGFWLYAASLLRPCKCASRMYIRVMPCG